MIKGGRLSHMRMMVALGTVAALVVQPRALWAVDGPMRKLTTGEQVAIVTTAAGSGALAQLLPSRNSDPTRYVGHRANSLDRWWRARLHSGSEPRTNFLDNTAGSLLTPVAGAITIACLDIQRSEFSRDIPFFLAGAIMTGAVTDVTKYLVHRPRPYCQESGILPSDRSAADRYHTESFFSGHSSQAFFAAGFVNNRLRRHMRQEWTIDEYRSWRWASPALTFGWASFVGLSRIQADKHHFTDVLAGAMVGYTLSELYYRLCYSTASMSEDTPGQPTQIISLRLTF